jgi:hypothetical protein
LNKDLPVTNCTAIQIDFSGFKRRRIEAQCSGGAITGDSGVLLLRAIDHPLQLTERIAEQIFDPRDPDLLRQRWPAVMRI